MGFKRNFLKTKDETTEGSYLKYEEGEVVPVDSRGSKYPPFLNDEEEKSIKQFKDIISDEPNQKGMVDMKKSRDKTQKVKHTEESSNRNGLSKLTLIIRLFWLVVIGGLFYYSIPIFQYFTNEKPDVTDIKRTTSKNIDKTKETINDSTKQIGKITEEAKDGTKKAFEQVSEGSGIKDMAKSNLKVPDSINVSQGEVEISEDDWLSFLSTTQSEKQEMLIQLHQATNQYINSEISQSRYRLLAKGITRKASRLEKNIDEVFTTNDTTDVDYVLDVLKEGILNLEEMSVNLGSTSSDSLIEVFNRDVDTQNELTAEYRDAFKSLLEQFGKSYNESNGTINYQ